MNPDPGVAVIYSRVSCNHQEDNHSLEAQQAQCRRYIDYKQYDLLGVFEEVMSGGKVNRPQLDAAIQTLVDSDRSPKVIVFYSLSRLTRNWLHFSDLFRKFNDNGITMYSIAEQIDYNSAVGRAMMVMTSVFANLEREQIGERTKSTLANLIEKKCWVGRLPYGYTIDKNDGKLIAVDEEMSCVDQIFRMIDDDVSVNDVVQHFNNQGLLYKDKQWNYQRVYQVKKNRDRYQDYYPQFEKINDGILGLPDLQDDIGDNSTPNTSS